MDRLRVLLLAESCNPEWPSLPVVGFKAAMAISEIAKTTLVTHVRNKAAIDKNGIGQANVTYLDNEYIAGPMYKLATAIRGGTEVAWTTNIAMSYLPYIAFEHLAWKKFRTQLRAGEFDVVHRLTPMSPTLPSPFAARCPIPFVLGPLNGGLKWPRQFRRELGREREWATHLRSAYRFLPYAKSTYSGAAAILAAFQHTLNEIPEEARDRAIDLAEVGFDPKLFNDSTAHRCEPITFLFVGRLVPYKCADVAVEAFAGSPVLQECRMRIVGEGPELASLLQIAERHQAMSRIEFIGRKTQDEVGEIMRRSHIFAFPSIRELGAGVVVEAMACGMCCIVVNYGGPGGLIDESRGIKLPLSAKPELVKRMRAAMEDLASKPRLVESLGTEARRYALAEYSWAAKAAKTTQVYEWVTGKRHVKPSFN